MAFINLYAYVYNNTMGYNDLPKFVYMLEDDVRAGKRPLSLWTVFSQFLPLLKGKNVATQQTSNIIGKVLQFEVFVIFLLLVFQDDTRQTWAKPLADGSVAVAMISTREDLSLIHI